MWATTNREFAPDRPGAERTPDGMREIAPAAREVFLKNERRVVCQGWTRIGKKYDWPAEVATTDMRGDICT
jgi:hypothetical protein